MRHHANPNIVRLRVPREVVRGLARTAPTPMTDETDIARVLHVFQRRDELAIFIFMRNDHCVVAGFAPEPTAGVRFLVPLERSAEIVWNSPIRFSRNDHARG